MPERPLTGEREAMRHLLHRLTNEVNDLETLCKHVPRIVSVATTTARVQAALECSSEPDSLAEIRKVLDELDNEEEGTW